ncbi:MAG: ABC transporter ATP-binding protein [Opitutales bacterium]|nr:ABC transporter ATP-binding protein [Opitutales bacterium]
METFLKVINLSKSYHSPDGEEKVDVFSDVNLEISRGSSAAIVGPSGSGKSTLLNLIGTLDKPNSGEIYVDGRTTGNFSANEASKFRNQSVGFIFQSHHLLPQCTVTENVMVPALAGFGNLKGKELHQRAEELLEKVGLSHRMNHRPSEISGGEKQRVAVARALINQPDLLLADEPTGALDKSNSKKLIKLLVELNQALALTLLMVTHSQEISKQMKATYLMDEGKLTEFKT